MANLKQNSKARIGAIAVAGAATLLAFPAIASAAVTSTVAGGVLTATSDGADPITITCVGGLVKVNGANPAPATNCTALTSMVVNGGDGVNAISLAGVTTAQFPNVASTTIDGGDLTDTITGSGVDDTIIWNPGDDSDVNDGGAGTDTIRVNGGNVGEQFTVKPSATLGRVAFDRTGPSPQPGPFNLDIVNAELLDLNANGGDDRLDSEGNGLNALGFKLDVSGGDGNDFLDGGDAADTIAGDAGNDTIQLDDNPLNTRDVARGGDGDDQMIWNGGDDDDVNDGGAGNDTVTVNGAPVAESFTLNASATAGHATFDRAAAPGPGPFNIDITASERLDMNLNGGDDTFESGAGIAALGLHADVEGADGNDTITGSDAADLIDGGAGNDRIVPNDNPAGTRDDARGGEGDDTIVWNGGDDDDLNEGGAGNDVSEINGAPVDERFTIKPSPTAGRVLFDRLATPGPGPFSVDIGTTETLHLLANAGNDRIRGAKGVAGQIETILDAGDGNDRIRGTDAVDAISAGKGHDFVNSIDRAEDTVSCDQGIDLALVDRRDFLRQCELVIGGLPRVAIKGTPQLDGNRVALRLKCVATARCKSVVKLKRAGKLVGKGKATLKRGASRDVEIVLNKRGRRVLSDGDRVKVQVVSKDKRGNGWRSAKTVRLG